MKEEGLKEALTMTQVQITIFASQKEKKQPMPGRFRSECKGQESH